MEVLGLGLQLGLPGIKLGLKLLLALAEFDFKQLILLPGFLAQTRFGGADAGLGLAFPFLFAERGSRRPTDFAIRFPGRRPWQPIPVRVA